MTTKISMGNSYFDTNTIVPNTSLWLWVLPLLASIALGVLLILDVNVSLFYGMNHFFSHLDDGVWTHFSLLADGQFVIMFVLPFLGRRPDVVWQFLLATLLAGLVVSGGKELFSELRPPAVLLEGSFHLIGPALKNNSFPSGHTTAAFILAGLVCLHRVDIRIKSLVVVLAIFVGFSRIANGVHWPQDVLAGAIAGWFIAYSAIWLSKHWRVGIHINAQRGFALILTPFSIWAVWSLWQHLDDVYPGTGLMKVLFLLVCLAMSARGQLRLFNLAN